MRKLLLILLAFIAIFTFIRTLEKPEAAELGEVREASQKIDLDLTRNFSE